MKNEKDSGTSVNINNSAAEKPEQQQIMRGPNKAENVTEDCTEIQDPYTSLVKTNKFDWKQNGPKFQIEECELQVLPKKSEKFNEILLKNSELFEGTRTPKNKNRKRRHCDKIVDLTQEKHNNNSSKLSAKPPFISSLLPVTNVWLRKRGVDLFPESQRTRENSNSSSTTEENVIKQGASLVTAVKEDSIVAEQANQIHKVLSTASTFIPPISTENENWDSDSTGSEIAHLECEKDNYSCTEENKTAKLHTNMQEVLKNNSRNKCSGIYNVQDKSLKNVCNSHEMFETHENIELAGGFSNNSKYLGVRITENSDVSCDRKTIVTKCKDTNCNNYNQRTTLSSKSINGNRLQNYNDKVIQRSKSDIKLFETDKTVTVSSSKRLEVVPEYKLLVKNSKTEKKCLDVSLINQKPLCEREIVATSNINFINTSKQGENFEINKDPINDKPSQKPVFKLDNPEMKKINHKTCYFHRSRSKEPKFTSGILPRKQDKPNGFETESSKSINEGVSNNCERNRTGHVKNVKYVNSAACPDQLNEVNLMVDTGNTQENYLKIDCQERSVTDKVVEPLMQEISIEQLLQYEATVPNHSLKEKTAPKMNPYSSNYQTHNEYGYESNMESLFQTTWNHETNLHYNQFDTTDPYMKPTIPTGWVPYLNPGMSRQSAVIQPPIPPGSVLLEPQLPFLNPSQHPCHNYQVVQPPDIVQQSDYLLKSNSPEQTRNLHEPMLVPPSGTLCNPYFPIAVPQVINSQQIESKIFDCQQHRKFVPVVQLECGMSNTTKHLVLENHSAQDYDLPPRLDTSYPHLSQGSLQEVIYSQPLPPKAELYYQNLQNMMQVDLETLNQQMRNLLLHSGSDRLMQTSSYGCTTDFGRHTQRQNTPQVMTTDQQIMTQYERSSQVGSTQSDMSVTNGSGNSHQVLPLICGNSSPITWQQMVLPFTQLRGPNHSFGALPQTSGYTNVQGKGVTPMTSLSLAAKGRGRHRNPDL